MFPRNSGRARGSLTVLFQTSLILGPALASILVGPIGFTGLLWLNSLTFLAPLVVWFLGINPVAGQERYRAVSVSLVESLRAGLRIFARRGKMGTLIALMVPASFTFSIGTTTLFVFLSRDVLGASLTAIGVALAVANIGGLAGAFVTAEIPRWQIRTVAVLALSSATGLPSVAAPTMIAALNGILEPRAIFLVLAVISTIPLIWLLTHRAALRVQEDGGPAQVNRKTVTS